MPVEIRELVITLTLDESDAEGPFRAYDEAAFREEVVRECVNAVLAVLKDKAEP